MEERSRGRPPTWTDAQIERELSSVIRKIGHWPTGRELRERGRTDLLGAIHRRGGLRVWARRLGYEPNRGPGERYWTDKRIRETLRPFLKDRAVSFPTRREFEEAGLSSLWQVLQDRGDLGRWAREFRLEEPRRGRPLKNG